MSFKISKKQVGRVDKKGFSANFYVPLDQGLGFNCLTVDVETGHDRTKVEGTTRVYYVIEGKGVFILGDKSDEMEPGDVFVIEDGEEYEYSGKMKLFEFNVKR